MYKVRKYIIEKSKLFFILWLVFAISNFLFIQLQKVVNFTFFYYFLNYFKFVTVIILSSLIGLYAREVDLGRIRYWIDCIYISFFYLSASILVSASGMAGLLTTGDLLGAISYILGSGYGLIRPIEEFNRIEFNSLMFTVIGIGGLFLSNIIGLYLTKILGTLKVK